MLIILNKLNIFFVILLYYPEIIVIEQFKIYISYKKIVIPAVIFSSTGFK